MRRDELLHVVRLLVELAQPVLRVVVVLALRVPRIAHQARAAAVHRVDGRLAGHLEPGRANRLGTIPLRVVDVLQRGLDAGRE